MGIENIEKLIQYVDDCVANGVMLDRDAIKAEYADLDAVEKSNIVIKVVKTILSRTLAVLG